MQKFTAGQVHASHTRTTQPVVKPGSTGRPVISQSSANLSRYHTTQNFIRALNLGSAQTVFSANSHQISGLQRQLSRPAQPARGRSLAQHKRCRNLPAAAAAGGRHHCVLHLQPAVQQSSTAHQYSSTAVQHSTSAQHTKAGKFAIQPGGAEIATKQRCSTQRPAHIAAGSLPL